MLSLCNNVIKINKFNKKSHQFLLSFEVQIVHDSTNY